MPSKGFTLIEMMVTIAIAAIVASIAVPSFADYMESYRLNQSAKQMLTGLREGRSRAAALKNSVIVCSDRDSSGAAVSETACVTNAIPSATAADFIAENRVVLVQISQGVDVSGAEDYVFNPTGSVRTAGSTEFCLAGKEREIRVAVLGAVDMREGTC